MRYTDSTVKHSQYEKQLKFQSKSKNRLRSEKSFKV